MLLNRNKGKRKQARELESTEQDSLFALEETVEPTRVEAVTEPPRHTAVAEARPAQPPASSASKGRGDNADNFFFLGDWDASVHAMNDYLYGDIPDQDVAPAFHYEFGRQLQQLRQTHSRSAIYKKMFPAWQAVCNARAFPTHTWPRLSTEDRDAIRQFFERPEYALFVQDLTQNPTRQFLETLIRRSRNEIGFGGYEEGEIVPAMCREQECLHALMTFDLSQPKRKLMKDFGEWLDRPEIAEMMERLRRRKGRAPLSRYRAYLRDLAVSLIYDRMGSMDGFARFMREHRRHGVRYFGQSPQRDGADDSDGVGELCPTEESVLRRRAKTMKTVQRLVLTPPDIFELSADPECDHSPMDRGKDYWREDGD